MQQLVGDIAYAIRTIDRSAIPFKQFQPGVGPYGEPQLLKAICRELSTKDSVRYGLIKTCRTPDILVPNRWALEFKIVRPFGDNGIEAEHWSQNLLHPYPGNVSAISDVMKLMRLGGIEKRASIVVCYEHEPPKIDLAVLVSAFEKVSRELLQLPLGERHTSVVTGCIHPVHQRATVFGWAVT